MHAFETDEGLYMCIHVGYITKQYAHFNTHRPKTDIQQDPRWN